LRFTVKPTGPLDEFPELGILGREEDAFRDTLFESTHGWILRFCVGRKHGFKGEARLG
jgi:hypothetical protein